MSGTGPPASAGAWGTPLLDADPRRLGPYRLTRRLGSGGMATVYLGEDDDGRAAAVKVVRADLSADPDFAARLVREVRVLSGIASASVARVLGADPSGDPAWLAVEFVPGPSLAAAVRDTGPLELADWSVLAVRLLRAVAALHAAGVVHRDLTPGNVVLGPDGPTIIDFGIALADTSTRVTSTGRSIGTPGWMAPEQLQGHRVGSAADVYSAGCLLAHAATGRPPHGTGTRQEVTHRVLQSPVDVAGLPALVQRFVGELTAKDPAERPTAERAAQRWLEVSELLTTATTASATLLWPAGAATAVEPRPVAAAAGAGEEPRSRQRWTRAALVVVPTALVALGAGLLVGHQLPGSGTQVPTSGATSAPASSAGPSGGPSATPGGSQTPGGVVTQLPALPSDDPTSQEALQARQEAARRADHPFPGGVLRVRDVFPAENGPARLQADVTADFGRTFDGGYRLDVVLPGMGGTSTRFSTCLDVEGGQTTGEELTAVTDTAGDRWTSVRVQLVADPTCPPGRSGT